MQVITDVCGKIAVLEICSDKNTRESVVGTFKNTCTVAVHCWYIKDAFEGFCQQIFKKKSEGILGKIGQKTLLALSRFWVEGLGESVKKGKFATKIFFT